MICRAIAIATLLLAVCRADPSATTRVRDLRSGSPSVRANAARCLGRIGDKAAVPALIEALRDSGSAVRREAAKALGFLKDARAVAPLVAALRDTDTNVRLYAAYALGEIKDPGAAPTLLKALDDPEWAVRDQAAWALRELHDPSLAAPLAAALRRKDADAAHIVWVLRHLGAGHAITAFSGLLDDPSPRVRLLAVGALRDLGGKAAIEPLIAAVGDADARVRFLALEALLETRDERAKKPIQALAAREKDPAVRAAAQQAALLMSRHPALIAHWSFDDRNTKVAKDIGGGGIDGEIHGCVPAPGKVKDALKFSKGKYIELGKPKAFPIANVPFTVMAWVKSTAPSGVVVARGGAWCGFSLYIKDGVAKFGIHRVKDDPSHIAAGRDQVVGPWVHLAAVVKSQCIELYVNGKLAASAKTPGYIPGNCGQGMAIGFDTGNSPAEICDHFQGVIDEVKVFGAALSPQEIAKQSKPDD